MKSFLLLMLLLGVISASTGYSSRSVDNEDVSNEMENEEELDEEDDEMYEDADEDEGETPEEERIYPSLICTLFTTQGCDASCQIVGNIYGTLSTGYCDNQDVCSCEPSKTASLETLWNRKFDSRFVLPRIKVDPKVAEKVKEILKTSKKSSEETKKELKSVLPDQYQKIRIVAKAFPNTIPQADGKFNKEAAKKYTNLRLRSLINDKSRKGIDYKKSLIGALETAPDDDAFQHLVHDVRRTNNQTLGKLVDEYLKSNKKQESPMEKKEEDITDFVNNHIINGFIRAIPVKCTTTPKPKSVKSAPRPASPKKTTPNSNRAPSKSSTNPVIADSTALLKPLDPSIYPPMSSAPYPSKIPNFTTPDSTINKALIESLREPVDKIWSGPGYYIRYNRQSPTGPTLFSWRKNQDEVHIKIFEDGAIDQIWHFYTPFGYKVPIWLFQDTDGSRKQIWKFANTRYEYDDKKSSQPYGVWDNNNKYEYAYTKYGEFIKAWCDANDFFIGKERCVIF